MGVMEASNPCIAGGAALKTEVNQAASSQFSDHWRVTVAEALTLHRIVVVYSCQN